MRKGSGFWLRNKGFTRFMSVFVSVTMVLSLLPSAGVEEARNELLMATAVAQETQSTNSTTDPDGGAGSNTPAGSTTDGQSANGTDATKGTDASSTTPDNSGNASTTNGQEATEGADETKPNSDSQNTEGNSTDERNQGESNQGERKSEDQNKPEDQTKVDETPRSANLADFITEAEVEGVEQKDGKLNVNEGEPYIVRLTFAERGDKQFSNEGELTFALPQGFTPEGEQPASHDALVITYADDNGERQNIELGKDCWWIDGTIIHMVWKVRDAETRSEEEVAKALDTIYALTDIEFVLNVAGTFAAGTESVAFGAPTEPIALSVAPKPKEEGKKDAASTTEGQKKGEEENNDANKDATTTNGDATKSGDATGKDETKDKDLMSTIADANKLNSANDQGVVTPKTIWARGVAAAQSAVLVPQANNATQTSDLTNVVTDVNIVAPMENGKYKMTEGESYTISLSFAENDNWAFPTDGSPMTYNLPTTGLTVAETGSPAPTFNIKVTKDNGEVVTVKGNTYEIVGDSPRQLKVTFNQSDPNVGELNAANNARFSVSFSGDYDGTTTQIVFPGAGTKEVVADTSNSVMAGKSAYLDLAAKKLYYNVSITSQGKSTNVNFTDTISDPRGILSLNAGSVKYTSSKGGGEVTVPSSSISGNTINHTIDSMANGEVITLTYYADVDTSKIPDGQVVEGKNKISVKSQGDTTPDEKEVKTNIDYTPKLNKEGMTLNEDGKTFHCKYTFNSDRLVGVPTKALTDTLGDHLTLANTNSFKITKTTASGSTTETLTLNNGTATNTTVGTVTKNSDKQFTFTTPNDNTPATYVVEYDVEVTGTEGVDSQITVENTVVYKNKPSTGTGVWTPPAGSQFKLYKTVDSVNYDAGTEGNKYVSVDWTATINVPEGGLDNANATLVDTLPGGVWVTGQNTAQYDSYVNGSIDVKGLQNGETYKVISDDSNHTVTVDFYKSSDQTDANKGLTRVEGGRLVTVKFTTRVNAAWLAATADSPYLQNHTNNISMHGETASATAVVTGTGVEKTATDAGFDVDGLPVYEYAVILKNPTSATQKIEDHFDRSLLEPYYNPGSPNYFAWYTTTENNNGRSDSAVSITDASYGMDININADSMITDPKSPTGFPPKVKIIYYLKVKDQNALKRIQQMSVTGDGTATIGNRAHWDDDWDGGEVTYKYRGVDKEMFFEQGEGLSKDDEDIYAHFRIKLNPGGATVNSGGAYSATDTVTNLSILQNSIVIMDENRQTDPEGKNFGITYDMTGDNLTFLNVPDSKTFIIEYRARAKFDTIGETGQTVDVNFDNKVKMLDYEDHVSDVAHRRNTGQGAAEQYSVNLMKYETGNMATRLDGAKFELYNGKADGSSAMGYVIDESNPVRDKSGNVVSFVSGQYDIDGDGTNDKGMIRIYGDEDRDGWSIHAGRYYFLKEVEAPADHKMLDYNPTFMVSADGTTNYDKYIYHSGDTLTAKNTKGAEVHVEKSWSGGYTPASSDSVVVKLQQRFLVKDTNDEWVTPTGNTGWNDNIFDADGIHYIINAAGGAGSTSDNPATVTLTLNKDNNWRGDFKSLPLFVERQVDSNRVETKVEYQIKETKINGQDADTTGETDAVDIVGGNGQFYWHYGGQGNARTINNSPLKGSLKLNKVVTVNGQETTQSIADGEYTFTITGPNGAPAANQVTKQVKIRISNGKATGYYVVDEDLDYKDKEPSDFVELEDLLAGTYTITEATPTNGTTLFSIVDGGNTSIRTGETSSANVTVTAGKSSNNVENNGKATFTNNVDVGGLKLTKAVTVTTPTTTLTANDTSVSDLARSKLAGNYTFTVYTNSACTTQAKTKDGTNAQVTITIGNDGNPVTGTEITNLPVGTYYVKETAASNGVALSNQVLQVEVKKGETTTKTVDNQNATITNNIKLGKIKIKKNVTVNGIPVANTSEETKNDVDGTFIFQIWKDAYKSTEYPLGRVKITFQDGVATSPAQYEWISERNGETPAWHEATVTDGTVEIGDLEPGTYVIHENEGEKYLGKNMSLVGGNQGGGNNKTVVVNENQTTEIPLAEFTNNKTELGELELSKKVISSSPTMTDQVDFTFTVIMYTDDTLQTVDQSVNGNYGDMTFTNGVATVKIHNNQSALATGLPTGRYYKITEASATNFQLVGITNKGTKTTENLASGASGAIIKTKSEVEFENKLEEGDLEVKKIVANSQYESIDNDKEFTFTVTLTGSTLTGTYGDKNTDGTYKDSAITFTNGSATFKLKHGQSKKAIGLPKGTPYTVTETDINGYTITWTGKVGSDSDESGKSSGIITTGNTDTITATNTPEYGELKVSKKVITKAASDSTTFNFTVTLKDPATGQNAKVTKTYSFNNPTRTVTFTNGVANFTLSKDQELTFDYLPVGLTYTVTEAKATGFTLTGVTGDTGTISKTQSKAEFENTKDEGGLTIFKRVNSNASNDKTKYFPFKVSVFTNSTNTIPVTSISAAAGDTITFNNGVAYVFLKDGQAATCNALQDGWGYQVEEITKAEATQHLSGGITADQVADRSEYNTSVQNGESGVPVVGTIQKGVIANGSTSSARFANTRTTGELTVSKELISDSAADKNQEFTFTVTLYKTDSRTSGNEELLNGTFGGMTFTNGVATVKLKGGQSVTASNLPVGLYYRVTEATATGFTLDGTTDRDGQITKTASSIKFKNTRNKGKLKVSKELISDAAADASQTFTFNVQLSDTTINGSKAADGTDFGTTFTNGKATVTIQGSGEKIIDNLPLDMGYVVTEDTTPGFTLNGVTINSTPTSGTTTARGAITSTTDPSTVVFTNERSSGDLTVSKVLISDAAADATKVFNFTIKLDGLTDAAKAKAYPVSFANPTKESPTTLTFTNGEAQVDLVGGQSATVKGLPTGVGYTITEANADGFSVTKAGDTGTISTTPANAVFTNTTIPGRLTVSKKLFSQRSADADQLFTYVVTLYKEDPEGKEDAALGAIVDTGITNKTYSGIKFTNGVSEQFTLKGGQSRVIDGLPNGIYYKVTETSEAGFNLVGTTGNPGQITSTASTAEFKNERECGGLKFKKVVTGPTAPDQVFTFTLRLKGAIGVNGTGFTDLNGTPFTYGTYQENNTTPKPISFKNGTATFKVKANQEVTVENLPLGITYTLTESSATGFTTLVQGATKVDDSKNATVGNWYNEMGEDNKISGTTYVGETAKKSGDPEAFSGPTFENKHEEGNLRIHKTVASTYTPDVNAVYKFRVELSDKSITTVEGTDPTTYISESGYDKVNENDGIIPFKNGVATFTLAHNDYASITGLPAGTTYTVTEESNEGITTTWSDVVTTGNGANTKSVGTSGKGTIVSDETATTTATNTREYGAMGVMKNVVSHTPADKTHDYKFKVTFYKSDPNVEGAQVATDIDGGNYKLFVYNESGNKVDEARVSINEGVSEEFTLRDTWYAKIAADSTANPELYGLPLGIYYKTEETPVDGMTTTTKLGQVTYDIGKVRNQTSSLFTNIRVEGGLFVYKSVDSHVNGDESKKFDFTVALYTDPACTKPATDINGTYGDSSNGAMTFRGGIATFSLASGEHAYAINLPVGLYFKAVEGQLNGTTPNTDFVPTTSGDQVTPVSEDGSITYTSGYNTDGTPITSTFNYAANAGGTGRIVSGERSVTVKNTRKAGNLKVTKAPAPSDARNLDQNAEFFFTVELEDKTINGKYGDMVFNNGVATFTLQYGNSASTAEYAAADTSHQNPIGTLPVGMRYRVTETNAYGYSTTWENTTWANDQEATEPTKYTYTIDQTWSRDHQESEYTATPDEYREETETRTISWGSGKTSVSTNKQFKYGYNESTDEQYGGVPYSWTHKDYSTEWGWREGAEGSYTGDMLVNAITVDNEGKPHEDVVTFNNTPITGSLAIYKRVDSALESDKNKTFHFHVRLLDSVANGAYGQMYFENGIGYTLSNGSKGSEGFDLKAGDLVVAEELPLGVRYVVTEDVDSDFESSENNVNNRVGYGANGEQELISDKVRKDQHPNGTVDLRAPSGYVNSRIPGELELRKTVESSLQSDKDATYTFNIELDDNTYNAKFVEYKLMTLKDDWGQDVYDVITGYDQSDSKIDDFGDVIYRPIYDTENGTLVQEVGPDNSSVYNFVNGKLEGVKLKDGEYAHFYGKEDPKDQWQPAEGEHAFVPLDETGYFAPHEALPRGVTYTITETNSNGLTPSWSGTTTEDGKSATGAITNTTTAVAECTNKREGGKLTVNKALISAAMADANQVFTFTVKLYASQQDMSNKKVADISGKFGDMMFVNGVATVELKGGDSMSAEGLPDTLYYTVTEASADGFNLTGRTSSQSGDHNATDTATTTNEETGELETKTQDGLWGTIIKNEPSTVTFTNERETGVLRITKQVKSDAASDNNKEFTFTVRLADDSINTKGNGTYTVWHGAASTDKLLEFSNGMASIKLKNGEYASIEGLPTGVSYTVTEDNTPGFIKEGMTTQDVKNVSINNGGQSDVIVNTRSTGGFTIKKENVNFRDSDINTQSFTFNVKLYSQYTDESTNVPEESINTDSTHNYGGMTFKDGEATVVLNKENNWEVSATNLPTGLIAVATEQLADAQKYDFRLKNSVNTITELVETGTTASFTNERITRGDLIVTKTVQDAVDDDANKEFTLKVALYTDNTFNTLSNVTETFTPMSGDKPLAFEDGIATVTLKSGERASATGIPAGMGYTVQEVEDDALKGFTPTYTRKLGNAVITEEQAIITEGRVSETDVVNTRENESASIKKVWNEEANGFKNAKSVIPDSIEVNLMRSDNTNKPYQTVTLTKAEGYEKKIENLPKYAYDGTEYTYTWAEPKVDGWTLESMAYSNNGEPAVGVVNAAGYLTTLTNTVDVGSLKLTKHLSGINIASLTDEDKAKITFTVADAAGTTIATNTLDKFTVAQGETDPSWTIEGLPVGTYTVTEANGSKYAFTTTYKVNGGSATTEPAKPVIAKGEIAKVDITNTHKPDKPGFDKKIKDTNDSTGETSGWQDSADYDIGDAVPYKLTATLAKDVTSYKKYHITFTDKMEKSLTYNKDAKITVTGNDGKVIPESEYTVTKVAENEHDFGYTLTWVGENDTYIANEALNGAKVEVEFTATLNSDAVLGKQGNVNACKLTFSNNPLSEDDKDEDELPWDYVIAFTFKMDISKVDAQAKALTGAEFKLEKLIKGATEADDKYEEVKRITNGGGEDKNVFTATGLDDGIYRLTETKAPDGYNPIDSLTFTVTAEHGATWDYTSDAKADPAFSPDSRNSILTALTGSEETGMLTLTANSDLSALEGSVINSKDGGNLAVKKKVSSTRNEDKTRAYGFKVTLSDKTINGKYGDMEFKDGVATFTLTHNDTKRAVSLPLNDKGELEYVVEETDAGGLTSSMARPVKSKDGLTHTVTCTNTYKKPTTSTSRTSTAKTGDSTNYIAVGVFAVAGVAILAGALINKRRRSK